MGLPILRALLRDTVASMRAQGKNALFASVPASLGAVLPAFM
jgi:hypothetical protein